MRNITRVLYFCKINTNESKMKIKYWIEVLIAVLFSKNITAQNCVKGYVYDANDSIPIKKVQINLPAYHIKIFTNNDGYFKLNTPKDQFVLLVEKSGYEPKKIEINTAGQTSVNIGIIYLVSKIKNLNPVTISSITDFITDNKKPVVSITIKKKDIKDYSTDKDLPEILNQMPSVYATKSGGGIGDSRINIRGFNQRNVAVLINGVPVNDMQTGWVYWSNWLNLPQISNTAQLQPGMGASKLAIPSVGGTINILTQSAAKQQSGEIDYTLTDYGLHKITAAYNTGVLSNGISASMQIGKVDGHGYVDMTDVKGYSYYFNLGYMTQNQKHQMMLNVIGSPQTHFQRNYAPKLADYLYYSADDKPNIKYNSEWGYLKGEAYSWSKNYFHKPIISFNWDWFINDHLQLSSVVYSMFGRGGGTGAIGAINNHYPNDPVYRNENGQVRFDDIYLWNKGESISDFGTDRVPDTNGQFINKIDEGMTRYGFMNNHAWYGGIFNLKYIYNDAISGTIGFDLRSTHGKNALTVNDVLGADGYLDNFDVNHPDRLIEPKDFVPATYDWNPFKSIDPLNKIVFYNQANINWIGIFGQITYNKKQWYGFLQSSVSNQGFQRIDYFNLPAGSQKSKWVYISGGNIKSGLGYSFNKSHYIFVSAGYFSKQPLYNAVFPNWSNNEVATNLKNEKIYATEAGYTFQKGWWQTKLNLYYTIWTDRYETVSDYINNQQVSGTLHNLKEIHKGIEWINRLRLKKLSIYQMLSIGDWYYNGNINNVPLYNFQQQLVAVKNYYLDGVKVGDAAQVSAAIKLSYRINRRLRIYLGQQYFDKLYAKIDVGSFSNPQHENSLKLPSYGLVNGGINYHLNLKKLKKISLAFNVNNLFDKKYIAESATNIYAQEGEPVWNGINLNNRVFFGWGRTYNFNIRVKI